MFRFLMPVTPSHSNEHKERRLMHRPRHRYEQPVLMFPLHYDATVFRSRHKHNTRNTLLSTRSLYPTMIAEMLQLHNHHRACHGSPPLTISQSLNEIAQSYAEQMAATSRFEHSGNTYRGQSLGENLYMQWISQGRVKAGAKAAVKSWYDEIALHNFDRPKFSAKTGHFTQMVWKSSKTMGVGMAYSPDKREIYIVTNYFPAGNVTNAGYFERNVLRPTC